VRRLLFGLLAILVLGGIGLSLAVRFWGSPDGSVSCPGGVRVEVLNGSGVPRLAAAVAGDLRSRGLGVYRTGNADSVFHRTTIVERRATDESNAARVAEFLGVQQRWWVFPVGRRKVPDVVIQVDSSRYLDVSVIVGLDHEWFFPGVVALR
jgi:hypothetical protein